MSIRLVLASLLLAAPAGAASLCRDTKGLYTPCAPGQGTPRTRPPRAQKQAAGEQAAESASPPTAQSTAPAPAAAPASGERSRVAISKKLCRDSKGLYTPCPR